MINITEDSVLDTIKILDVKKNIQTSEIILTITFERHNVLPDIIDHICYHVSISVENITELDAWTPNMCQELLAKELNFPLSRIDINNCRNYT